MAQTHSHPASETASPRLPDDSIYISVAGYIGVIPSPSFPPNATESQQVAIREGVKQLALRRCQPVAKKAAEDGKDVRAAVQAFLNTFEPDPKQEFQTIGSKRAEIGNELLRKMLMAAGKPHDEATVAKNLPAFLGHERHAPKIEAELATWLASYTPPTKRGSGGTTAASGADISLDDL